MTKKEDLEKLILDSYQIVHKNNQKILVAEPREKSRLRQENDENWEYIKTFLAEYTSLCEARRLVALEDIIDIAATRFPDISARLEAVSTAKPVSPPPIVPSTPSILSIENDSLFQVNYKFVHPFTPLDKEQLVQFIVRFNSTSSAQSSYLNVVKHICLVLDVSGSMNTSDKYPYLLQSIPYVIDSLQDNDKLSIMLFSTQSALVWSSDIATCRQHKRDIHKAIDQSHVKFNTTCLAPGLRMAIDEIKHV
ncbi:MAG TPA: VWA domain-containing protein, partial [Methylomirabilota bacterium]|nr:VWA domain-containing protein [Methylomirabilota bacterium]